jgi:hypothetical protein
MHGSIHMLLSHLVINLYHSGVSVCVCVCLCVRARARACVSELSVFSEHGLILWILKKRLFQTTPTMKMEIQDSHLLQNLTTTFQHTKLAVHLLLRKSHST